MPNDAGRQFDWSSLLMTACLAGCLAGLSACAKRSEAPPEQKAPVAAPPSVSAERPGEAVAAAQTNAPPEPAGETLIESEPAGEAMAESAPREATAAERPPAAAAPDTAATPRMSRLPAASPAPPPVSAAPRLKSAPDALENGSRLPTLMPTTIDGPAVPASASTTRPSAATAGPVVVGPPLPPTKPAAPATTTAAGDGVTTMRVFYGTDRAALTVPPPSVLSAHGWFFAAVAAAIATIAAALAAWRQPERWSWTIGSGAGLLTTAGLGLAAAWSAGQPTAESMAVRRVYGNQRGEVEMGICEVTIPAAHRDGELETPSIFKLEFSSNPLRHIVVERVEQRTPEEFTAELRDRVATSAAKEAFVFVHGYNVSFENAARRTAQIAHDLKFDGAPAFFSWPSQGGLLGYTIDENNVVWTVPHLKEFLLSVARQSGADAVHLIAHSMGNRALTSALKELRYELDDACPKFRDVVLTAPDIDAEVFRRDLAPALVQTARRVTLYASSNDDALVLSKKVHGYARAGDSGGQLVLVPGMDTIDVSAVDTSLVGHSYYGNNQTVLADLYDLLRHAKPPEQRQYLRPVQLGALRYWVFQR